MFPIHRPPGAVLEQDFLDHCSRCGDCIQACPHDALIPAPAQMRQARGTPCIEAWESPCRMCEDTPCISACKSGVLSKDAPPKMAQARIEVMDCLAWRGSTCVSCFEQCPVEGAILLHEDRPEIQSERCTGCGVCLYVCPAPRKAILLTPEMERPPWKESGREP